MNKCSVCQTKALCQTRCYRYEGGLFGIQTTLNKTSQLILEDRKSIAFNEIVSHTDWDIKYCKESGLFTLIECDTYLVNWSIAVAGSQFKPYIRFALLVNDKIFGPSTLPVSVGLLSGSSLIRTTKPCSTLALINDTGDLVQLADVEPIANLTISKTYI